MGNPRVPPPHETWFPDRDFRMRSLAQLLTAIDGLLTLLQTGGLHLFDHQQTSGSFLVDIGRSPFGGSKSGRPGLEDPIYTITHYRVVEPEGYIPPKS